MNNQEDPHETPHIWIPALRKQHERVARELLQDLLTRTTSVNKEDAPLRFLANLTNASLIGARAAAATGVVLLCSTGVELATDGAGFVPFEAGLVALGGMLLAVLAVNRGEHFAGKISHTIQHGHDYQDFHKQPILTAVALGHAFVTALSQQTQFMLQAAAIQQDVLNEAAGNTALNHTINIRGKIGGIDVPLLHGLTEIGGMSTFAARKVIAELERYYQTVAEQSSPNVDAMVESPVAFWSKRLEEIELLAEQHGLKNLLDAAAPRVREKAATAYRAATQPPGTAQPR